MPGWHEKTRDLVAEGKLAVAGIVQEQHAERAALFMQWKQMDWPVMVDSLNLLGVRAVPLTYLIDEHGVIRVVNPKGDALEKFLATEFQPSDIEAPKFSATDEAAELAVAAISSPKIDPAALDAAIAAKHDGPDAQFRLGVLHRMRHDSPARRPGDFANAIAAWGAALEANPAQYIWRRRIQQYGPRLDKPYPFYDWVYFEARMEIRERGDQEMLLRITPALSETRKPLTKEQFKAISERAEVEPNKHPDPDTLLAQDTKGLVVIEQIVVPSTEKGKTASCVYLQLTPSTMQLAQWDHDAGDIEIWIDGKFSGFPRPPWGGWGPSGGKGTEARTHEFEIQDRPEGPLKGSAFYYICEGVDSTCQYLRHDFEIELEP